MRTSACGSRSDVRRRTRGIGGGDGGRQIRSGSLTSFPTHANHRQLRAAHVTRRVSAGNPPPPTPPCIAARCSPAEGKERNYYTDHVNVRDLGFLSPCVCVCVCVCACACACACVCVCACACLSV